MPARSGWSSPARSEDTRLNSSHSQISYAVFCLKKKSLFQTAKFGTEMQYQHLVFEEFARTVQPMIDPFFAPTQVYDTEINPAIVAEFAHTVYRFGHSMLLETIDRRDPNFASSEIGLIAAFLNPLAFTDPDGNPLTPALTAE